MRLLSSGTRAAGRAASKQPVLFIEAEFRTAFFRMWTGSGQVTWRGQEWSGPTGASNGSILSIEAIRETGAVEATGLKFVLSAVPADLLGYCIDELKGFKPCRIWVGYVNDAGALVDDPAQCFQGRMDASSIAENPAEGLGRITVTVESDARRLQQALNRLLTHEDQQIDFPGDTGLKNMSAAANWKGKWGQNAVSSTPPASSAPTSGISRQER